MLETLTAVGGSVAIVTDTGGIADFHAFSSAMGTRTDDPPASGSPSTYRPEEVRVLNGIDGPDDTIRSDNLVIQRGQK